MSECIYTEGVAFRPKNPAMFGVCMLTRGEEVIRCRECEHSGIDQSDHEYRAPR